MPANKDKKTGKWNVTFYYTDWTGKKVKKLKRGFATKGEAQEWERHFKLEKASNLDMTFGDFYKRYEEDVRPKVRANTWKSKEFVIEQKILPYFKDLVMRDIKPRDILAWQNEMRELASEEGKPYSGTYLRTMQAQLSAIFNHAVKYYELPKNPVVIAGPLGQHHADEMLFWTKEEYMTFIPSMANKPYSYMAFELLYWCGIRMGELLALTPADFDFEANKLSVTKSYQRLGGEDVITKPKTAKSVRVITMPEMVALEIHDFLDSIYGLEPHDRIFVLSKSYLHHEMDRGVKETGVKRIRIHDLRHSHVSLLIDMGFYTNTEDIIETNGMGEIHWDRTINETYPIIKNERPYYVELQTKRRVNDEEDFIKRVHESVLTSCSKELKDADLLELLDLEGVFLTDDLLSDMGDDDYIISRLEKEMNVQFNTRKQIVLKTLIAIIKNKSTMDDIDGNFGAFC